MKTIHPQNQRDDAIDILRFIGLSLIILAHVIPDRWVLFQLRTFDVPMMVIVSAMAFCVSSPGQIRLGTYYWKRVRRLLLPTYVFLTLFFLTTALCFTLCGGEFPFQGRLLATYALLGANSIGYVWIVRVFLLVAVMAPLLHRARKRLHPAVFTGILVGVYILYEFAFRNVPRPENRWLSTFVSAYLYFALPYSVLFGAGMLLTKLDGSFRLTLAIISGIVFVLCVCSMNTGDTIQLQMQSYKYPPRIYYVSWGLFMSTALSFLFMRTHLAGLWGTLIRFMSTASLWIYLWHIAVLFLIRWNLDLFPALKHPWFKYVTVIVGSTLFTHIHRQLFARIAIKLSEVPIAARFVTEAFLK
jgi:peptidoglycan/LPS O-acetylase OafA/YrhL